MRYINNFLPFMVVSVPLLLAIAYGFWKDRPWSRHAAVSFWVVEGWFLMMSEGSGPEGLIPSLIGLGITIWYFYVRPNVVAYYRAIATKPGAPPAASSST